MKSQQIDPQIRALYTKTSYNSQRLLKRLSSDRSPFREAIKITSGSNELNMENGEDSSRYATAAKQYLHDSTLEVSPFLAIPILVQAINDYYYPTINENAAWLGTALKTALAYLVQSIYTTEVPVGESLDRLMRVVRAAGHLDYMQIVDTTYKAFPVEGHIIRYTPVHGPVMLSEELHVIWEEYGEAYGGRGPSILRTVNDPVRAMWWQPSLAVRAIESVLRGGAPVDQAIFKGTIFEQIPIGEPPEFWAGLWVRFKYSLYALRRSKEVAGNPYRIAIWMPLPALQVAAAKAGLDVDLIEASARAMIWNKDWVRQRIGSNARNMIVERPIIQLPSGAQLFVTTSMLIADSFNWFVEASVFRYYDIGGVPLSQVVFDRLVSRKFEKDIINIFLSYGFKAGSVTSSGVWYDGHKHIKLINHAGERMPGEIDVLAYDEDSRTIIMVECKVLNLPFHPKSMLNLQSKIGDLDTEGFHSKVAKKLKWLRGTELFSSIPERNFDKFLMFDRWTPGSISEEGLRAITPELLIEYLEGRKLVDHLFDVLPQNESDLKS
jgi:hypothetical protein